jgi:peptidoglycan/LPS O-acetylase OafA/YrhL
MSTPKITTTSHVDGLNTLRLAAAVWVALSHGARLPLVEITGELGRGQWLGALNNGLFNGVAAVMMFFVISGFVIHRPQAGGRDLDPADHYVRRLTRIVPPVIFTQVVCFILGPEFVTRFEGILWSVYCEIAYYAAYPLLPSLFRRFSIYRIFVATTLLSLALIAWTWPVSYHSELDIPRLVLIGLPSWILGCLLAERDVAGRLTGFGNIWAWRAAAVALSAALKVPVTHGPVLVGYPAGHWLFAIFAFFWLGREIVHFRAAPPPAWTERLGNGAYSLYLAHTAVIMVFAEAVIAGAPLGGLFGTGAAAWLLAWAAQLAGIAALTTAFYLLVEAPFHRLARRFGRKMGRHRSNARPAVAASRPA